MTRTIQVVHALPGRVRLRCSWLRDDRRAAHDLAARLADHDGVIEVRARPYTSSLVIEFAPDRLDEGRVIAAVRDLAGDARVLALGEQPPPPETIPPLSRIAQRTAHMMKEIDADVRRATSGAADLGTLTTLAMFAGGVYQAFGGKKVEAPHWFTLAWNAVRAFTTFEQEEIDHSEELPPTPGEPAP